MTNSIQSWLETLKLEGMLSCFEEVLLQVQREGLAVSDALLQLLENEYRFRQERLLAGRLQRAKLPWNWSLDTFPFEQQPGIRKPQIMELAKLAFLNQRENLIFIGKPGTGKTGIALGLLRLALLNGYRGRFFNAQDLLNELYTSLADKSTSRLLKHISRYDVMVIDELGYLTLTPEQVNIFFKLIDLCYRKTTILITTNLAFEAWYDVFKQKDLVDAMLDRFQHFCTTIHIDGPSLRISSESSSKQQK